MQYLGDITHQTEEATVHMVEQCARNCYRSETGSRDPVKFLTGLRKSGHLSLFEQSQLVIKLDDVDRHPMASHFLPIILANGKYRFFDFDLMAKGYIGGNLRCWIESYDQLRLSDSPIVHKILGNIKRAMPEFFSYWTDIEPADGLLVDYVDVPDRLRKHAAYVEAGRDVLGEWTRHDMAYCVESSRYCNYSKGVYNTEIDTAGLVYPGGMRCKDPADNELAEQIWQEACKSSEKAYMQLTKITKAEMARQVLNMSLLTRWYVSAIPFYWSNFFKLRDAKDAHPNIRYLANTLRTDMNLNGIDM